uniref:DUF38 domain-containing protein n=1 Tax=Panagrolaimus davidi TaxID=227884 RepID=A0A914QWV4_9BILA
MDTSESEGHATSTLKRKRSASGNASDVIPAKRLRFIAPNRRYDFGFPDPLIYYVAKNPTSAKLYKKLIKNVPYKIWVNGYCVIGFDANSSFKKDLVSSFLPRIYRCEIEDLSLQNQELTIDEFLFVTAETGRVCFSDITVVNRDGKEIAFEKLVELIPEVYSLKYYFKNNDKTVTSKTVKELLKLSHHQNFIQFRLFNVSEAFDIEAFFAHIKNSEGVFQLEFGDALSVAYQSRLEAIIDELIEAETFYYIPPFISYPEMDDEKCRELYQVCRENDWWP